MLIKKVFVATVLLFGVYWLQSAVAEEGAEEELPVEIESYARIMPSRAVSAMPGRVQLTDVGSEYCYDFKLFDKLPVELSLGVRYVGIKNTTQVSLPPHLTKLSWGIDTTLPFFDFDKTYLRIGITPSFYSDDWSFESSSFRLPSRSFLVYQPDEKWTYIFGIAAYPDFETEVYPIFGFIYKPNDKLIFNIIPDRPNINYMLNERLGLFAEFDGSRSEFEVTRNNSENVVLIYKEYHVGAGVEYKFNKFVQSSISAGNAFGRALKYRDNEGKVALKDGLYTEFRINIQM